MNCLSAQLHPVRFGLMLAITAMLAGAFWAAYLATHHEQLHHHFEKLAADRQVYMQRRGRIHLSMETWSQNKAYTDTVGNSTNPKKHNSRKGVFQNRAKDAIQHLLYAHIHFMGVGMIAAVLSLIIAFTSLKAYWKKTLAWMLGLGALAYPSVWIFMGFYIAELGPEAAKASVIWLFGPAIGVLLASIVAVFAALIIEAFKLQTRIPLLTLFFNPDYS